MLNGIYDAIVVDNEDPEGLYRVKFKIPGLIEPESNWAYPYGTIGGGSKNRGGFLVPEKGAIVGACFVTGSDGNGNPDAPRYWCGYWPEGMLPDESQNGNKDIFALSLGGVRLTLAAGKVDDNFPDGRGYARLRVVPGGNTTYLEIDGETNTLGIGAARAITIITLGKFAVKAIIGEIMGRAIVKAAKII